MKIYYKTQHGVADRIKIDEIEDGTLSLIFEDVQCGAVILGSKILPLRDCEATLSVSELANGEYTPRLECELGVYYAEGFTKSGKGIYAHAADEALIRRLLKRCYTLKESLNACEARIAALENEYQGHRIFNFERKEK